MYPIRSILSAAILLGAVAAQPAHALPPPDPSEHQDYGCLRTATYVWNDGSGTGNVSGKLYRPSVSNGGACTTEWPADPLPLVVLAHGNGFAHTAYADLASHLALNGFAVVSVNTGNLTSASDRADKLITYIHGMLNFYSGSSHLSNQIALVGHSRGGEGVVAAAIKIKEQARPWTVQSVVALAPTDAGNPSDLQLTFDASRSLLVLTASRDGDVVGRCVGDHFSCNANFPTQQPSTGFSLYDRAGGWSLAAPTPTQWMNKAFVFLHGATHGCFSDQAFAIFEGAGTLSCGTQRAASRGYVNAYLRWRLLGDADYRPYFTNEEPLPAVADLGIAVRQQFQEFGARVLDNFEDGQWWTNTLGDSVEDVSVTLTEAKLYQIDSFAPSDDHHFSVPHDGRGLHVRWNGSPFIFKAMHNNVPFAQRNVSGFGFLGLRAAQMYSSAWNSAANLSFRISLTDLDGGSDFVDLSSYGGLPEAEAFNLVTNEGLVGAVGGNYSKTALQSFRIPLADFAGVDLTRLDRVTFSFSGASGEVILDDVVFTQ